MAGDKKIPITRDGEVIGEGTLDENGLFIGEIFTHREADFGFNTVNGLSVWSDEPLSDKDDIEEIQLNGARIHSVSLSKDGPGTIEQVGEKKLRYMFEMTVPTGNESPRYYIAELNPETREYEEYTPPHAHIRGKKALMAHFNELPKEFI